MPERVESVYDPCGPRGKRGDQIGQIEKLQRPRDYVLEHLAMDPVVDDRLVRNKHAFQG